MHELPLADLFANAPILEPVRASFRDDKPLHWIRVHDLPDFVYFNHSIHVKKGVGLRDVPRARRPDAADASRRTRCRWSGASTVTATREKYVRPRGEITRWATGRRMPQSVIGPQLVKEYGIKSSHQLLDVPPVMPLMNERNDLEALRARLEGTRGREYWRSLEVARRDARVQGIPASRVSAERLRVARSGRPARLPEVDGRVAGAGRRQRLHAPAGRGDRSVRPPAGRRWFPASRSSTRRRCR